MKNRTNNMDLEKKPEVPEGWQQDPLNDIKLYQKIKFELPRAGTYHDGSLNICYIWNEEKREIKYALLTFHCPEHTETTPFKIYRQEIINKMGDTTNNCHSKFCKYSSHECGIDRRFFLDRTLRRFVSRDFKTPINQNQNIPSNIEPDTVRYINKIIQSQKNKIKPKIREQGFITKLVKIEDISDIDILSYMYHRKQGQGDNSSIFMITKGMEDAKLYLEYNSGEKKLESLLSFLTQSITEFIRRGLLELERFSFSRVRYSEFKLTKKGKYFVEDWEFFNELDKSENFERTVEEFVEGFLSKKHLKIDQIMLFFYKVKEEKRKKKISIAYIKNHCDQAVNLRKKTVKIRKRMKNFPHEKYFSRPFEESKLDKMLKSRFRRELNYLLKEDLDRLIKRKLLKFRRNRYRLTWSAEFKEK